METITVDARGQACPKPLILTKKALKDYSSEIGLKVLIDNDTSRANVERFLSDNGITFNTTSDNGIFAISIRNAPAELMKPDAESYCQAPQKKPGNHHTIVIRSDKMGQGPDDLGSILIKAFINTLKEVSPLPETIIFYNSGILLTTKESSVAESLQELESKGVTILVCGTCVDYFQKKSDIIVGTISNMYTILEKITLSEHVITP